MNMRNLSINKKVYNSIYCFFLFKERISVNRNDEGESIYKYDYSTLLLYTQYSNSTKVLLSKTACFCAICPKNVKKLRIKGN